MVSAKHVTSNGISLILSYQNSLVSVARANARAEVTEVVCDAIGTSAEGSEYFVLTDTRGNYYYVWLNIDEDEDPAPNSDWNGVEVSVSLGDTASDVATAVGNAIDALTSFSTSVATDTVTITHTTAGQPEESAYNVDTDFTINVTTEGIDENQVMKKEAPWNDAMEVIDVDLQDAASADLYAVVKVAETEKKDDETTVTTYKYDYRTYSDWFSPS